jgi:hypothetical protein
MTNYRTDCDLSDTAGEGVQTVPRLRFSVSRPTGVVVHHQTLASPGVVRQLVNERVLVLLRTPREYEDAVVGIGKNQVRLLQSC